MYSHSQYVENTGDRDKSNCKRNNKTSPECGVFLRQRPGPFPSAAGCYIYLLLDSSAGDNYESNSGVMEEVDIRSY
jgi:hypothetical protein